MINEIGKNIHHVRKMKNISVEQLALDADIDKRQLYRIENGEHQAGIITIIKISKVLDMDMNDLVKGVFKDEKKNQTI